MPTSAGDDGWEERMAARAKARREALKQGVHGTARPRDAGELPAGQPDIPRYWCTECGLPDAPVGQKFDLEPTSCPRCGCPWRWHGRIADRDGTAEGPPDGACLSCYEWRRYPGGQSHFGWAWWRTCAHDCPCAHHADEVWLA